MVEMRWSTSWRGVFENRPKGVNKEVGRWGGVAEMCTNILE